MAHRIGFLNKAGAYGVVRIYGQPDRDMAVIRFQEAMPGALVKSAEFVEDDAPREWGEQDLED